jgi:diguanylate cyclase (GGDEF)-like protein
MHDTIITLKRAIGRWSVVPTAIGLVLLDALPACAQSTFARGTLLQWPDVLTGAFLGFLLLTVAYNIAFFVILHERFLLWQATRVVLLVALTISLSSLPLGPWLSGEGLPRQVLINLLFDASIAMVGLFLRAFLEPGMISPRLHRLLGWQPMLIAATTPAMLLMPCPPLYKGFRNAVLAGVLLVLCASLAQAIRRGSRTACFQALAWAGVLMVCGISLFHDIVLGRPFTLFLYALFTALALEMLLSSFEVGDRFMRLKREHDQARARAEALDKIAHTDPLTGLHNRRSLEARFVRHRPRAVAVLDIDFFKQINDGFGHDQGDAVIVATGAALASGEAFAARIGGEEFALLLYGEHPVAEAEALRCLIPVCIARDVAGLNRPVTASGGVAALTDDMDFAAALRAADLHLYAAKAAGRNRLIGPHEGSWGSTPCVVDHPSPAVLGVATHAVPR